MIITPPRIDYTNKDYQALVAAMLELGRKRLPEWSNPLRRRYSARTAPEVASPQRRRSGLKPPIHNCNRR